MSKGLGKRDPNPYWFNIEIFAVIASNTLKIRQVFSAVFSLYRQKSLMLNCSHLTLRCFSQDFSAAGCRQADACQIRQAERLQKHPSSGNACSSLVCLGAGDESELFCSRLGAYIIYLQNTPYGYGFCKYIIYAPSLMRIVRKARVSVFYS